MKQPRMVATAGSVVVAGVHARVLVLLCLCFLGCCCCCCYCCCFVRDDVRGRALMLLLLLLLLVLLPSTLTHASRVCTAARFSMSPSSAALAFLASSMLYRSTSCSTAAQCRSSASSRFLMVALLCAACSDARPLAAPISHYAPTAYSCHVSRDSVSWVNRARHLL